MNERAFLGYIEGGGDNNEDSEEGGLEERMKNEFKIVTFETIVAPSRDLSVKRTFQRYPWIV